MTQGMRGRFGASYISYCPSHSARIRLVRRHLWSSNTVLLWFPYLIDSETLLPYDPVPRFSDDFAGTFYYIHATGLKSLKDGAAVQPLP